MEWGSFMFCGHADTESHLCASQRGPSGTQKVRTFRMSAVNPVFSHAEDWLGLCLLH